MHKSAEELFAATLELTNPIERVALLDRECAGNPELRAEVESLLAAHEQAGTTFINEPAASQPTVRVSTSHIAPLTEKPGDKIDRYKLLQQIGEGGFGDVRSEEHTSELQSLAYLVCRLLLEKK